MKEPGGTVVPMTHIDSSHAVLARAGRQARPGHTSGATIAEASR